MTKYIYIALFTMLMVSCNDDFMDRQSKTQIGDSQFFKTEQDLKLYSNGLYNFPSPRVAFIADSGTDNQATTSSTVEIKVIMGTKKPSSETIPSGWNWSELRRINILLKNIQRAEVSDEIKKHYEGIGRFFRARFYMEKVKRYSDVPWYGVPLITSDKENLYKERDSRDEVIKKIFEDYAYAAENVKEDQASGAVNKWVVLAYISRDALYEGTFRKYHPELKLQSTATTYLEKAEEAAKQIIDSKKFAIYSTGKKESDYHNLFVSTDLSSNKEVILARFYDEKLHPLALGALAFGNYEACPTKDLLQAYLMQDGSYYSAQQNYNTKLFVDEFKDRDLRLKQTYAYPGWKLVNTSTYASGAGVYVQEFNKSFSGYHQIKGFVNKKDRESNTSVDYPVLRYAEVLLNFAEAKAELGKLQQQDVNISLDLLRERVGMPKFNMNPAVDVVAKDRYPNISTLLCEIRRERRVEMAFEGLRFDDLMRWNAGKLLEKEPEGIYFPGFGQYDMTGNGVKDILLYPESETAPSDDEKIKNSAGKLLIYYKAGSFDKKASVCFSDGKSGNIITVKDIGTFVEPTYYYRPIPAHQVTQNKKLLPQLFGWN